SGTPIKAGVPAARGAEATGAEATGAPDASGVESTDVTVPDTFAGPNAVVGPQASRASDALTGPDALIAQDALTAPDVLTGPDVLLGPDAPVEREAPAGPGALPGPEALVASDLVEELLARLPDQSVAAAPTDVFSCVTLPEDVLVPVAVSAPEGAHDDRDPSDDEVPGYWSPFYGAPYVPLPHRNRRRTRVRS
ncbi:hypothetical protein ABZ378_05085, partial [Streptomyces sp. NPDC005907]